MLMDGGRGRAASVSSGEVSGNLPASPTTPQAQQGCASQVTSSHLLCAPGHPPAPSLLCEGKAIPFCMEVLTGFPAAPEKDPFKLRVPGRRLGTRSHHRVPAFCSLLEGEQLLEFQATICIQMKVI